MKPIARGQGRSAVAAAAYRAGERLADERTGLVHDFTRKRGIAHTEIILPEGVNASWARNRETLWNKAESVERRKDARTAREFEIALPHELTAEQRLDAVRLFAKDLVERYGAAIDMAIHEPHEKGDVRNHHAHLMMTVRQVGDRGFGDKTMLEQENKKLLAQGLPTTQMQLRDIRLSWELIANRELARTGHDVRIDHRSHQDRGLEIEPTRHMGVHATEIGRRGHEVERSRLEPGASRLNERIIREKPEQLLEILTHEKSVFDRHDVARAVHRYTEDAGAFQRAFHAVMASRALVELEAEGPKGRQARYSTRDMVKLERGMVDQAETMAAATSHGVAPHHLEKALERHNKAMQAKTGHKLSQEQRDAVAYVTSTRQLDAVVGVAGAGKSTMLAAAREAWEAQGYRVRGAALAGKAAEGLEESSGIDSRTLASFEYSWKNGRSLLGRGDVLVIDEAGMISSRQMARFVAEAKTRGAKLVLVGDPEQLQAIGAGAPFRAIAERTGFASLDRVHRQREAWQRQASVDFAKHRTDAALQRYEERGAVQLAATRENAQAVLVRDYMADLSSRQEGSRLALAHRRKDVHALNDAIRQARKERGELAHEQDYETQNGRRGFAAGDRIVFLENNRDLGVKNGMLGTVEAIEGGRITARLDGRSQDAAVTVSSADYAAIDHGYATTIHKSQGATVDRAYVLASETMDRHLAYVAMTRHRETAALYAGRDEFKDQSALRHCLSRARQKEITLDYVQSPEEAREALSRRYPPARSQGTQEGSLAARGAFDQAATGESQSEAIERQKWQKRKVAVERRTQNRGPRGRDFERER